MEELLYEAFTALPRGGPGNAESTRRAFASIKNLPESPKILDVGCGTGLQTIELAKLTGSKITALDNYTPLGNILYKNAEKNGVISLVNFVCGDMENMDFLSGSFDLIWSEGAIYNIGFENGLRNWKKFLRNKGSIAVTEISWIKSIVPDELKHYWVNEYPAMLDIDSNCKIIESAGYCLNNFFILPEAAWWDDLYIPLQKQIIIMREKYKNNNEAQQTLDSFQEEIEIYRKYSDYYGYVFYIMKNK